MTLPKKTLPLFIFSILASGASAGVYKCVDESGRITYTNDQNLAGNGCTQLSEDLPVSSIPPPDYATTPKPAATAPSPSATPSSGGNFPRVSPSAQRERDSTRRQILEKELADEQMALQKAQAALAEQEAVRYGNERNYQKVLDRLKPFQDQVEVHKRNVDALQREISALR